MFEVLLTDSAESSYNKLNAKLKVRANNVFMQFENGDFQHNNITALHGPYKGYLRYRLGQWRIVFQVNYTDRIVTVTSIIPRGEDYKL